jgi:hypothetical protein
MKRKLVPVNFIIMMKSVTHRQLQETFDEDITTGSYQISDIPLYVTVKHTCKDEATFRSHCE